MAAMQASCCRRIFTWMTCSPTLLGNCFSAKETRTEGLQWSSTRLCRSGHRDRHPDPVCRVRVCVPANAVTFGWC